MCSLAHVHACSITIQSPWTQFYTSGLTWERDASVQSAHLRNLIRLFFFAYYLRWMYISTTHTALQEIQKKKRKKKQEDNVTGSYNAEISLHKAIPFKIQHLYCLKYKITISRTRLNLSLFQNLWFHSLMNVLLNSYHVTAIPSLNHSLLDAQRFAALK